MLFSARGTCSVCNAPKCVAQKLPVEPGIFVLRLTQPSISPATMARKRRKLDSGKPLPVEPPEAPSRDPAGNNSPSIGGLHSPAGPLVPAVEEDGEQKFLVPQEVFAQRTLIDDQLCCFPHWVRDVFGIRQSAPPISSLPQRMPPSMDFGNPC